MCLQRSGPSLASRGGGGTLDAHTMTDENGTEATRSDAPSADESLFGDAAGDAAAATVEEQDPKGETAEDGQGSE